MIVLHLANCPAALRGDLTKWLLEISTGIYVGRVSARIRDRLWGRVVKTCNNGRAVLVYSINNEQGLDFRVHGDTWEPIDFDGLKLMLRPDSSKVQGLQESTNHGFSNAAKLRAAKRTTQARTRYPETYVVFDLETTGLDSAVDEIIEIGALKVLDSAGLTQDRQIETFHALVLPKAPLSQMITSLTGIDDVLLKERGRPLQAVLPKFMDFVGALPLVAHNVVFDKGFIDSACAKCGFALMSNRCVDTLSLVRRLMKGLTSYKLEQLALSLELPSIGEFNLELQRYKSLRDCYMTHHLYQKLLNIVCG